ncbi:DUF647 domain protein [Aspergillus heteromorphus CBS 117.55]|uniref:DUF647 domain protein n=1 Tax=Aspergillus heteromorphus CBS 117.55 TaxID=1448321 RepID=A0A317VPC2_9EURO|nr:DUF647 domain protein [Aspergillus heteromorphus CBS 117.55]PWY76213.1 DUF647 domain protein [Aspergillus heteromorphus CBS 117.55]
MTLTGTNNAITFTEVDDVNHPRATYIYSAPAAGPAHLNHGKRGDSWGRVDVANAPSGTAAVSWSPKTLLDFLIDVFLPAGYPHSVTDDYVPYQIFDSLQAFSSSIAGLLSSRAVLQGVGVGNASASPTSALLLHILQDSSGRVATILFAHRVGTALEPECKMYRLAADVFNDLAMILDCLSPMIPAGAPRVTVLSTAGVLRALCGVAGGSSKASLSAHFSRWGNLAEVNAVSHRCPPPSQTRRTWPYSAHYHLQKDSSQETIISLIGMLVGSFVVSHVTGFAATWISLLFLLALHLGMNYAAVRSVQMTSLNRQRANIVFSTLLASDPDLSSQFLTIHPDHEHQKNDTHDQPSWRTLTPAQVANQEKIFEIDGILRWSQAAAAPQTLGSCQIGVSLQQFLAPSSSSSFSSSSSSLIPGLRATPRSLRTPIPLPHLSTLFSEESYILYLSPTSKRIRVGNWHARILLKNTSTTHSQLKAWAHALLAARILSRSSSSSHSSAAVSTENEMLESIVDVLDRTLQFLNENGRFERYVASLVDAGWDPSVAALETRSGRRIVL